MKPEYDELYKCWVVWQKKGNCYIEIKRGTKKNCESFISSRKRKGKKYGKNTKCTRSNEKKRPSAKTS